MAVPGLNNTSGEDERGRKNRRNRILLASLAALALLSLFVLLGNPGLWTPDERDEPEAEATDGTGDDSDNSGTEPVTNSSDLTIVTVTNDTSSNNGGFSQTSSDDEYRTADGSGYVISYGTPRGNTTTDSGSGGGGGGGGRGGGSGGDDDDNSNTNGAPAAQDLSISTNEDTAASFSVLAQDGDGDEIAYSVTSVPSHGSLISFNTTTGAAVYMPAPDFSGVDSFVFKAEDSHGAADTAIVTLTVNGVGDAPIAVNSTEAETDEDLPVDVDLNLSVSDPDGSNDTISIVNMTQPQNGEAVLHSNNTVTYTPDADFNGVDQFSFQASDGTFVSGIGNVTITVHPVNDSPRAQNLTLITPEDTPIDVAPINNSSDVDGDVTRLEITQLPSSGVITISQDNTTVTYNPNENFAGTDSFEYVISDGVSNSTGNVEITVTPVNDAPTIIEGALGSVSVDEDGSTVIDIISNVFDPEGDTVTITNVTQPSHGTVTLNPDGTVTYTPEPNYNGQDSFEFTVDDGNGGTTTGTVTITVNPVNDVPVSQDTAVSSDEDATSEFQLNSTDTDGDVLTFTLVSFPLHGTATMVDSALGIVEYTPIANYNGADSLKFQSTDGSADSQIATLAITVNPVNDDPVANNDNYAGSEDEPIEMDVLADDQDIDGDALSIEEISDSPSHGMADINLDNTITYTPDLDFNGTDSFEYKVSDGNGGTDTATVTVSIGAVNDAPDSDNGSASVDEDSSVEILLNSTDSDGNPIEYALISMPLHGELEVIQPDGSLVRYTPSADYNGADQFSFQTTDGFEDSNVATVLITVNSVNDEPIVTGDNVMGQEDSTFGGNVLANDQDIDGDALSVDNWTSSTHGVVSMNPDGTFTYTPEQDYTGSDSFQYVASDGNGGFATASVLITVSQSNDAPVANDDSGYTTLEQPVLVMVLENDSDIDSSSLNVGSVGTASHGTVTIRPDGKGVTYTPSAGFSGEDQFAYAVTDGAMSDTATVTIKVYNIKFGHIQPPVGGGGDHEFEQGNTASVRLELKDANGDDIVDALVILTVQQFDENNIPAGPVVNATSAGGSNEGNVFDYSTSWYQYNLKTEDMSQGKWALYVYMIDTTTDPFTWVLLEDQPIDGISTTIIVK